MKQKGKRNNTEGMLGFAKHFYDSLLGDPSTCLETISSKLSFLMGVSQRYSPPQRNCSSISVIFLLSLLLKLLSLYVVYITLPLQTACKKDEGTASGTGFNLIFAIVT